MKKILFFIGMIAFLSAVVPAQPVGGYDYEDSSNFYCDLLFSRNGVYYFSVWKDPPVASDVIIHLGISIGKFYMRNDTTAVLRDTLHGYEMVLHISHDYKIITIKHSFAFLLNKQLILYNTSDHSFLDDDNLFDEIEKPYSKEEKERYAKRYKDDFLLKLGMYTNRDTLNDYYHIPSDNYYTLSILPKRQYALYFTLNPAVIMISKGRWSRNGNTLILYDTTLKYNFYMLIGENKLISDLLPLDYYIHSELYYQDNQKK